MGGRTTRGVQMGRPHEWGDLRKGGVSMWRSQKWLGPAHHWHPLSVWKGWGAQTGRAHANGARMRGAVNKGDGRAPKPETELACSGKVSFPNKV